MSLKESFEKELTSKKVEQKGQWFYKQSKWLILIGLCGVPVFFILCVIGYSDCGIRTLFEVLTLQYDEIMSLFTIVSYVAILLGCIGIGWYFYGIQTFALGRIAVNTEKENDVEETNNIMPEKTVKTVLSEEKPSPDQKKCWACGTVQDANNRFCINCNEQL